jgi:hypothetical protein
MASTAVETQRKREWKARIKAAEDWMRETEAIKTGTEVTPRGRVHRLGSCACEVDDCIHKFLK